MTTVMWRARHRTGIVAALREELAPLLHRVRVEGRDRGRRRLVYGSLGPEGVVLTWTGEGVENARRGIASLLDECPIQRLLILGVAGALSPSLPAGALLIAGQLRSPAGASPPPDRAWLDSARQITGVEVGTVVTVDEIVDSPDGKATLWEELGQPDAAAVDMESSYIAGVAAARGIPYLVVRAISDTASEALPAFLNDCRDDQGGIDRLRVLRYALSRPRVVRDLLKMRRRVRGCAGELAEFAGRLLTATQSNVVGD